MRNQWTRTDLAIESGVLAGGMKDAIQGVQYEQHSYSDYKIVVTKVIIEDENGEKALGRKRGTYVTIESEWLKENHLEAHQEILKRVVCELKGFLPAEMRSREDADGYRDLEEAKGRIKGTVMVAGLGNRQVTADALGPAVVDRLLVSRHMMEMVPDDLKGKLCTLCAVTPGVMGQTGIETKDILQGIIKNVKPDILIVIDALSTASIHRMNTTIQISDTGISPGAGMGNHRQVLSKETLGIPVLAIGIPTVIDAATLVSVTLENAGIETAESAEPHLMALAGALYVTPKDMDIVLLRTSSMLAGAINQALHDLSHEEMQEYLY